MPYVVVPIHTVYFEMHFSEEDETERYSLIKLIYCFYFVRALTVPRPFTLQLSQISTLPSIDHSVVRLKVNS